MTKRTQRRFAPHGALAILPKAFGAAFDESTPAPPEDFGAGVAVVTVRGPLMHHEDYCFDSYTSILARAAQAIEDGAREIVLDIDSPGGLVSGAFDAARQLRAMCEARGVALRAHVTGQATSAAYAIATAASWIGVSRSASLGSIGVIDTLVDVTEQNKAMGINVQLVTSGARKADGNPNVSVSDEALGAAKTRVDMLAGMFFDLVVEHGWAPNAESVAALQASVVTGEQAVTLGLASGIATLAETIAFDARAEAKATETGKAENTMAEPMEDAVASLRKMAEDGDEEESKKARAALKALGEDMPDDEESSEDEESAEEEEEAKAEEDKEEMKAEEDEEKMSEAARAHALATQALAKVHTMEATAAKQRAAAERATLLASRPDFGADLRAVLSDPKTPLATVRKMCAELEKGPTRVSRTAAATTATGTRGEAQGTMAPRLPPEEKLILDQKMGLLEMTAKTINDDHRLSFGVRRPVTKKEN